MVDTFFLKLENNLADKENENMFDNEDELIEYSEQVAINYENLFCSDYLKSEVRKYIIECANIFDSKFETDYDKIYIDNWFDFITSDDFEKVENEDDDQEDNISLYSEIEEETEDAEEIEIEEIEEDDEDDEEDDDEENEEDGPETDQESDDENEEGDEQIEDDIYHVRGQIEEMQCRSRYDFPISGYGIEPKLRNRWQTIHIAEAHKEAKDLAIKKEQAKLKRLIEENKQYKKNKNIINDDMDLKDKINELGAKNANHIREKEVLMDRIKFLEAMQKQDNEIINQMTKQCKTHKLTEETNKYLMNQLEEAREKTKEMEQLQKELDESQHNHSVDARALFKEIRISCDLRKEAEENEKKWVKYAIEKDEQDKNLRAVIDALRKDKDDIIKQRDGIVKQRDQMREIAVEKEKEKKQLKNEYEAKLDDQYSRLKQIEQSYIDRIKSIKNLREDNVKLIEQNEKILKQRDEFRIIIDNKDETIDKLEEERDKLISNIDFIKEENQEKLKNHKAVIDRLREEAKELNNEVAKKQELFNSAIKQRDELQNVIINKSKEINILQTERDDLKAKLDFKTKESDYFNERAFNNAKEANTLNCKLDKVKKILIE